MFLDWICKGNRKCFLLICPLSLSTGSYFHPHFHFSPDHWICLHRVAWEICRTSVSPSYLSTFTFNFHFHFHQITGCICISLLERFAEIVFPPLPYLSTFTFTRLLESSDWIYLHRVTWERFAEWVFPPLLSLSFHLGSISQVAKCPLYPISTSASWVNTLSDPFLCLLKLTFDIIWNPPSYISDKKTHKVQLNMVYVVWNQMGAKTVYMPLKKQVPCMRWAAVSSLVKPFFLVWSLLLVLVLVR